MQSPLTGAPELLTVGPETSHGAGVVLDDSYIITSAHLVDGAARVTVRRALADGPPMSASIVGVSVCDGLALLRVSGADLPPARLGTSADLRLGAAVVALGYTLAGSIPSPTASDGIISWLGPTTGVSSGSLMTTSAALLDGGTGGPLINSAGEVVGIMAEGSFAAPARGADYVIGIDYAQSVVRQLRGAGAIIGLGLTLVEAGDDPVYARAFDQQVPAGGLFIRSVSPDVAAAGGLRPGDLVVAAASAPVQTMSDLCGALGGTAQPVAVEALRRTGGSVERIQATVSEGAQVAIGPSISTPPPAQPTQPAISTAPSALSATVDEGPAPSPAAAVAAAVTDLSAEEIQAARAALALLVAAARRQSPIQRQFYS